MTRKEMIEKCVDDQIARGITKPENREYQIKMNLNGHLRLSYTQCVSWYESITKT